MAKSSSASPRKAAAQPKAKSAAAAATKKSAPSKSNNKKTNAAGGGSSAVIGLVAWAIRLPIIFAILRAAYVIRLYAIQNYGLVIHEFDPWFNFRATQYLADNGWTKFFEWFDYQSWYPLGRPVGTTIYPGMQITSVFIHDTLKSLGPDYEMSLNDVCCYVPAWFGVSATFFVGLLTYETMKSVDMAIVAAGIMAIIPAHIMRSVGGGYDNESVAMTAMCATFYFWVRSVSEKKGSFLYAIPAGLAYFYMVASWGGYIFVLNMVALHALVVAIYTRGLRNQTGPYLAFTIFYILGTSLAIQVPVVGWTPLKSLEQLGAFGIFGLYQLLQVTSEVHRRGIMKGLSLMQIRVRAVAACAVAGLLVSIVLLQQGYFGPLSSRIRGLFVKHTRTGNPLVDSVAEHQATSADAYWRFLHATCHWGTIGLFVSFSRRSQQQSFIALYALVAYYFSAKMSRLMILMGPVASILTGVTVGAVINMVVKQINHVINEPHPKAGTAHAAESESKTSNKVTGKSPSKGQKAEKAAKAKKRQKRARAANNGGILQELGLKSYIDFFESERGRNVQLIGGLVLLVIFVLVGTRFYAYCHMLAEGMSNPSIIQRHLLSDGTYLMVDDYREAYWWLRDNTPEDARVMAWWDYGYQITGIANRTTIADGNTWNHEHIATLGRTLTAPVHDAHKIARHLADYILIWTGGGGDDLAKSPHMARIGNSVYPDICPNDPTCRSFGFIDGYHNPTPMMAESLLYNLHSHNAAKDHNGQVIQVNPKLFREVFTSKYKKVRIFQVMGVSETSKAWVADPANRDCDVPGGWFCRGQYPPALHKLIAKRNDFAQLEDFNTNKADSEKARKYQEEYHARMSGKKLGSLSDTNSRVTTGRSYNDIDPAFDDFDEDAYLSNPDEDVDFDLSPIKTPPRKLSTEWQDTPLTSKLYSLISDNRVDELAQLLADNPTVATVRSGDGRGPLWWAYEFNRREVIDLFIGAGAKTDEPDSKGVLPNAAV